MSKYDFELKLKIVKENEEGYGQNYLAKKYGIHVSTIRGWIEKYTSLGESGLRKSMSKTKYSGEFKLSVLQYRQNHELSFRQTAEHFGIKNLTTIASWSQIYEQHGSQALCGSVGRSQKTGDSQMPNKENQPKKLSKSEREELIALRERNEYLEAENLYLKKLDALLQEKKAPTRRRPK